MKLEEGKRYRTRDGQETSPLEKNFDAFYPFGAEVDGFPYTWTEDGRYFQSATSKHRNDLVEEIEEEEEPNENLKKAAKRYKESEQEPKIDYDKYTKTEKEDGTIILKPKKRKIWIEVYEYGGVIQAIGHTTKDILDESVKSGREDGENLLEVIEREYPINKEKR